MVKNSPTDAQNSAVWATLMGFAMGQKKYKEAYRLFTDMKRRGIKPTSRTFGTLLKGYTQIEDWSPYTTQLENVCSLYDQVLRYHTSIKRDSQLRNDLSNIPYNLLIEIFGKAQDYRRMFDVSNSMDTTGPASPDIYTYTCLLNAIANRKTIQPSLESDPLEEESGEVAVVAPPSPIEVAYKNADEAKIIWHQLLRICGSPDLHAIRAAILPLSRGRPSDQQLALDIVHEYLGLSRPGEKAIPSKLPLHAHVLSIILSICNRTSRYRYTIHYVEQVMDSDRRKTLAREHMELVLEAHAGLAALDPGEAEQAVETLQWMLRESALPQGRFEESGLGPQIKPTSSTFDLVALACFYGGDWKSMCRTFELMTGLESDNFRGELKRPRPDFQGQRMIPSGSFMACFLRLAAKSKDVDNIKQALNVFKFYDSTLGDLLDSRVDQDKMKTEATNA
ncbi:hypothetical protein M422DRAFT_203188, partial [Sphaerobolus stellatus SS14]